MLEAIERAYGFVPLVNQVLSSHPGLFVPQVELSKAVFMEQGALSERERELVAIGAASASCAEHCMDVHIKHAKRLGVGRDEVMEAMMVGSMIAMNRTQSYAFRKLKEAFEE